MALRWVALPRPRPGHAEEFERLWRRRFEEGAALSPEESARLRAISVPAAETRDVSRGGRDAAAAAWTRYHGPAGATSGAARTTGDPLAGAVVPDAAPPPIPDAEPSPLVRRTVFPAEMILSCAEVIGDALVADAARTKRAEALVAYGEALAAAADRFARIHGSPGADLQAEADRGTPAALARTVATCARWCLFWGRRHHGCLADPDADH